MSRSFGFASVTTRVNWAFADVRRSMLMRDTEILGASSLGAVAHAASAAQSAIRKIRFIH
jgi:hypothetical protein